MKEELKKLLKHSLKISLIVTIVFALFHMLSNTEYSRNKVEDIGFDILNKYLVSKKLETPSDAPQTLLFGFDDAYMKQHHLFDEDNHTNYGYNFPRLHITKFIQHLDGICYFLKKYEHLAPPKVLFIDIDTSFGSNVNGGLSEDDKALLELLKKRREYTIVFPKTRTDNFIEQSKDEEIQNLIAQKKIFFGSVGFTVSKDNATRRYEAYRTFHNLDGESSSTYVNANIILWKLSKGEEVNISQLQKEFKQQDIIANRILIKNYQEQNLTNASHRKSNWENYRKYSALYHYKSPNKNYSDAIIVLGTTYSGNGDVFEVLNVGSSINMFGAELNIQTLMTLFYFDGKFTKLSIFWTILLVFYLVFTIDLMVALVLKALSKKESKWSMVGELIFSILVMGYFASMFLEHAIWFNWFVPTVLFELIDYIF